MSYLYALIRYICKCYKGSNFLLGEKFVLVRRQFGKNVGVSLGEIGVGFGSHSQWIKCASMEGLK